MNNSGLKELPNGWSMMCFNDLGIVRLGKTPRRTEYRNDGSYKIIKFRDIDVFGNINWQTSDKGFVASESDMVSKLREVEAGDVFVTASAHMSEHIGKKAAFVKTLPSQFEMVFVVGEILQIRVEANVEPKWVYYFLISKQGYDAIQNQVQGVHLIASRAKDIMFPVAPLDQQKRIVVKIEELFSHIDAGIEALKKAKQLLKQYRQSILKAAVTGELTKEWREANKNKLEPASQLLKCILKERRRKWEEKQLEKFKAKGKVPKDDKWKRKYKEPDVPDNSDLPTIPNEWLWSGFEQVSSPQKNGMKAGPFGSALKKKFYVEKGYKIYGQEQVISGNPYSGNYYISEEKYQSLINCSVQPGDFLISLVGTIGRTLVLPNDIESGIINPRLIKITFDKEFCLPEYMQIYIASPAAKQIFKLSSHGGTMDVLNMSTLKALPLPLPSVSEQQVIVEMVNEREETIERQLKYIDNQLRLIKKNKQSVLASAFSGSLNSM